MKLSIFEKIYYKLRSFWYFFCLKRRMDKIKKMHKKYEDAILKTHPILYWPVDDSDVRYHEDKSNQLSDHFKEDVGSLWAWSGKIDNIKTFDHALTPEEIVEEYEKWKKSNE